MQHAGKSADDAYNGGVMATCRTCRHSRAALSVAGCIRVQNMKGVKNMGEIQVIPVWRDRKIKEERRKRHKADWRDKVIVAQWFIIGAFAVLAYILQAGPI